MQILHGTWIPEGGDKFVQNGQFYLWVETSQNKPLRQPPQCHPRHLAAKDLATFLTQELGIKSATENLIEPCYFLLPTVDNEPLPSLELSRYLETELPESFEFQSWQVDSFPTLAETKISTSSKALVNSVIPLLNDLHFLTLHRLSDIQFGADLLFWYHFTQALKGIILKDQYIPALKYRELKRKFEIYPGWEFIGEDYENILTQYVDYMPILCTAGFSQPLETPEFYDRLSLLRHFSDCLLTEIVTHTYTTQGFEKTIADSILYDCLKHANGETYWTSPERFEQYQQWQMWRDRVIRTQTHQPFYLYFSLQDPPKPEDPWQLQFQVAPKNDPSLRVSLDDYWRMNPKHQKQVKQHLGEDFEQHLLLNLGYAARIYPDLWRGLETDQPIGIFLNLEAAFNFLKESFSVVFRRDHYCFIMKECNSLPSPDLTTGICIYATAQP